MTELIIVGAGPAGLYAAIKAKKAGINDILVVDPRVGKYTRPGHIAYGVFKKIAYNLGLDVRSLVTKKEMLHIKDLERALYTQAISLKIKFESKSFVRMCRNHNKKDSGLILQDSHGKEEFIKCDYIFDCTGGQRKVIHAVNECLEESVFKIRSITSPLIKKHMIAYILMDEDEYSKVAIGTSCYRGNKSLDEYLYAKIMLKLRALGWKEAFIPRCLSMSFGKNKRCFYIHVPDNLKEVQKKLWMQIILDSYANIDKYNFFKKENARFLTEEDSVTWSFLPPSKKYEKKPRFCLFDLPANLLSPIAYEDPTLPTIVALGDAQVDFDYRLGNGIKDGIDRIDLFFDYLEVVDYRIKNFNSIIHDDLFKIALRDHIRDLVDENELMKRKASAALISGIEHLKLAAKRSGDLLEKQQFLQLVTEFELRKNSESLLKHNLFHEYDKHLKETSIKLVFS